MAEVDDQFYDRADEHIRLSNDQLASASKGNVSASMMYSLARFDAWVSATGFASGMEMAEVKDETVEYFVERFRMMLEQNIEDYIQNFDHYMKKGR